MSTYGPDRDDDARGQLETDTPAGLGDCTPAAALDEAARVRAWRVERFAAIATGGMRGPDPAAETAALARLLADARTDDGFPVDLHDFERLVRAGCSPNVAADLLVRL